LKPERQGSPLVQGDVPGRKGIIIIIIITVIIKKEHAS
jgi:hypothetical protein